MNFRQFAFRNVVRKKRTYAAHFLSSAFSVMAFFIYAVLLYHPDLQGQLASSSGTASYLGTMGLKVSQYLIFIFSFLFLLYSTSAFLKARKKEFGILLVLGMTEKQRKKLTFAENMLIGLSAIGSGIGAGLLFMKFMLLISARLLMLEEGLRFYLPLQAVWTTGLAFLFLFLVVSVMTLRVGRNTSALELIKEDEKPKPEPKASVLLSLLAALLLAAGYGAVFYFVNKPAYHLWLLALAIGCVVLGTYLLFTQLSVYIIRTLKRREKLLFKGINLMTFTDLAYRIRDNAAMFFMVATVMAVAFSGIGVCLAIGDPERTEKNYPYAFMYSSQTSDADLEKTHLERIDNELSKAGLIYQKARLELKYRGGDASSAVIPLSQYNALAAVKGLQVHELKGNEFLLLSGVISRNTGNFQDNKHVELAKGMGGTATEGLELKARINDIILPMVNDTIIVEDDLFTALPAAESSTKQRDTATTYYVVPDWVKTLELSRALQAEINDESGASNSLFALSIVHHHDRQLNGILLIISVLVGVVFFTFAASFIYFRLYADVARDEKQLGMASKLGLSRKELGKLVTRQLALMFFLPFLVGVAHSAIAFVNMTKLTMLSMVSNALLIYSVFFAIQVLYFLLIRWRYLNHMYRKVA